MARPAGTNRKGIVPWLGKQWDKLPRFVRVLLVPAILGMLTVGLKVSQTGISDWAVGIIIVGLALLQSLVLFIETDVVKALALSNTRYHHILSSLDRAAVTRTRECIKSASGTWKSDTLQKDLQDKFDASETTYPFVVAIRETLQSLAQDRFPGEATEIRAAIIEPVSGNKFRVLACDESGGGRTIAREVQLLDAANDKYVATKLWKDPAGQIITVSDTQKTKNGEFVFLDEQQKNHLRSLICYKIWDLNKTPSPLGIICVDSDRGGMFPLAADLTQVGDLTRMLASFEKQIVYEMKLGGLIVKAAGAAKPPGAGI